MWQQDLLYPAQILTPSWLCLTVTDGVQFINALLPIPELELVKGPGGKTLPNMVEWFMDAEVRGGGGGGGF